MDNMKVLDFTKYRDIGGLTMYDNIAFLVKYSEKIVEMMESLENKCESFKGVFNGLYERLKKGYHNWEEYIKKCISEKITSSEKEAEKFFNDVVAAGIFVSFSKKSSYALKLDNIKKCVNEVSKGSKKLEKLLTDIGLENSFWVAKIFVNAKINFQGFYYALDRGVASYKSTKKKCIDCVKKFRSDALEKLQDRVLSLKKDTNYTKEFTPFVNKISKLNVEFQDTDILSVRKWAVDTIKNAINPDNYLKQYSRWHPKRTKALKEVKKLQEEYVKRLQA